MGDIINVSNGYYLPAPTRVVPINNKKYALISGLPTSVFTNFGLKIEINGVCRWINDIGKDQLMDLNIPIQPIDRYIGQKEKRDVRDLLNHIVQNGTKYEWVREKHFEAYSSIPTNRCYGFDYWGHAPLEIIHPVGKISLWRAKKAWAGYDYKIVIQNIIPKSSYQRPNPYQSHAINIPSNYYKNICLAIDVLSKHRRIAYFTEYGDKIQLSLNFQPPEELMRTLHITGSTWLGYEAQYLNWRLPAINLKPIQELLNYLGIEVIHR